MPKITLHEGDNRISLKLLADNSVDSVCTDAPYGLLSLVKRHGKEGSAPVKFGTDGAFARAARGFMGKTWDGTGIERDPEFWREVLRVLKPGGYCFAFSGSRTGHWQACAMEMAGFVMHPMHGWCFGSGFPKAHAADKAIDKMLKVPGGFIPEGDAVKRMIPGADQHKAGWEKNNGREYQPGQYVPGSPEAAQWEGWAYGTQAQKPALEPIYLGQKPFSEKTGAANLLKHGVGAVNIDGCRVPTTDNLNGGAYAENGNRGESPSLHAGSGMNVPGKTVGTAFVQPEGRHPANLILDGSPEVVAMFPDSAGQRGDLKSHGKTRQSPNGIFNGMRPALDHPARKDSGSAARFFHQFPIDADPLFYHPKAGKADRAGSKHPTVKPIALMQYLIRHITPPGGVVLDPFAGSGTTAEAARREGFDCILMEAEPEYIDFLRQRFDLGDDFDDLLGGADDEEFADLL